MTTFSKTFAALVASAAILGSATTFAAVATPDNTNPAFASYSAPEAGNSLITASYRAPEAGNTLTTASYRAPEAGNTLVTASYRAPEDGNSLVTA